MDHSYGHLPEEGRGSLAFGEEAYAATLLGEGVIVDKLLKMAAKDGTSTIGGICYGGGTLLKLFIEKMVGYPRKEFGTDEVAQLVITLQSVDCRLLDTLMYCADYLEIPRDRVHVISHTEGFIYYVLSQKKNCGPIRWGCLSCPANVCAIMR